MPYAVICKGNYYIQGDRMTRKDYRAIAECIRTVRDRMVNDGHSVEYADYMEWIAHELADTMKRDNANFKRDLFLEACGIES